MKPIYLASESKARQKLLSQLGLKFKILPSRIQEKTSRGILGFSGLAKHNAWLKAEDAARRVKKGLVIAADTITVQDGKIFGKPRNLKDAKRMLKRLSKKPQIMYTGLAVLDVGSGKKRLASERTVVSMDALKPQEIEAYFRKTSPLDKAGSFDIQGRGAFFIRRIDGCFYNVVGLPLRALYRMLKEFNISLLIMFLFISGCSTEYNIVTGKQEQYIYSTDKEIAMGETITRQVKEEYPGVEDPLIQKRVEDIGKKIAAVCDRRDVEYSFYVLDDDEVNAFALPGGFIFVNSGLIEKVKSDDELAGVLAHEVGHVVARHSIKKLQAAQGYTLLRVLIAAAPSSGAVGNAADAAFLEILLGYGREDELLADQLGARYLRLAGYNPRAMVDFLETLQALNRRLPLREFSYFKTHPYVPDRIRVVKQELGEKIGFADYINIEQRPHGE